MRYHSLISSFLFSVVVLLAGCNNPIGTNPGTENPGNNPVVGFNVTGKVLDKYGKPVAGARARLLSTGLSAISDANGEYTIKGQAKIAKSLAKRVIIADADTPTVEGTDTLVVTVANPESIFDSSEVLKTTVTSGIVMELPATYIVQREIAVPYETAEGVQIGRVVATVYDISVPEITKTIDLANDGTRKAFTSFAYFSSEKNKNYVLYTMVYDVSGKFIGRSADYPFSDNYGNLAYATPFRCNNATPSIDVVVPKIAFANDSAVITVNATDSFGGSITSCKVIVDNKEYTPVTDLSKMLSSITGKVKVPVIQGDSLNITVKAEDNDGNVTIVKKNVSIMESPYIESSEDNYQPSEVCVFYLKPFDLKNIYLKETKIKWIMGDFVEEITSGINLWNVPSDVADTTLIKVIFTIDGQEYEVEKIMIKGESIIDEPNPNPIDSSKIVY